MNVQRYLCSELVTLRNNSGDSVVNLEEIWQEGAILECEEAIETGAKVAIRAGAATFAGIVVHVDRHEFGWRVEMEFSPLTLWSLDRFRPQHMLDVSALKEQLSKDEEN